MIDIIPGFEITEHRYESSRTVIFRAIRASDNLPVILKVNNQKYPSRKELLKFENEFKIVQSIQHKGVIEAFSLEKYENRVVIVFEDFKGKSLSDIISERPFSIKDFLKIAISLAEILGAIHENNIIHKDINPSNILFDLETSQIKVIDFGISTNIPEIKKTILDGSPAYVSPEQTGRINGRLDYRTDFYSLGVTYYELLLGILPFDCKDIMEMIHAQIAKTPQKPCEINSNIPEVISDIILKLISKAADDRYKSATGLKADLETCLDQLNEDGNIPYFEIGKKDTSSIFRIPEKLYGREEEIARLEKAFEKVKDGEKQLTMVSGRSGAGKTSLVNAIHKSVVSKNGYMIKGCFEQYKKATPYLGFVQALEEIVKLILAENDEHILVWKERILNAVGKNGKIISDIVPDIDLIIGPQPEYKDIGFIESQNRLQLLMINFFSIFGSADHPVVLVIDNMQWADLPSVNLFKHLISDYKTNCFYFIGIYRDNEVDITHPLAQTLAEIEEAGIPIDTISLKPIGLANINNLICETLECQSDVKPLALSELIFNKTGGNPFFVNQFLTMLHDDNYIKFSNAQAEWEWNTNEIKSIGPTDNVVELMVDRIKKLSFSTCEILKIGSFLGLRFDLATVSIINKKSTEENYQELVPAINEGLVVPISDSYRHDDETDTGDFRFVFSHDRIRQAAYLLVESDEINSLHFKIGEILYENLSEKDIKDNIFNIASHLNLGLDTIQDKEKKRFISKLNLAAGKKAKESGAYMLSLDYLQTASDLLEENHWKNDYDHSLDISTEMAEAAYLVGDFEIMDKVAEEAFLFAKSWIELITIIEAQVNACRMKMDYQGAIKKAITYIKILGLKYPRNPTRLLVVFEFYKLKLLLFRKKSENILDSAVIESSYFNAVSRMLIKMGTVAVFYNTNLFVYTVLYGIRNLLLTGINVHAAFAYLAYSLILCVLGDIKKGKKYSDISIKLLEKTGRIEDKPKIKFLYNTFIRHWSEHIKHSLPDLLEGYQVGIENGDHEYAAANLLGYDAISFSTGMELHELETLMVEHGEIISHLNQKIFKDIHDIYLNIVSSLNSGNKKKNSICGNYVNLGDYLSDLKKQNNRIGLSTYYILGMIENVFFENYDKGLEYSRLCENHRDNFPGTNLIRSRVFYDSIIRFSLLNTCTKKEKRRFKKRILQNIQKIKKWNTFAPMNNYGRLTLLYAELDKLKRRNASAEKKYDQAIKAFNENGFIHEEGLANELAAKFYLERKRDKIAKVYMEDAYYCYERWGAEEKTRQLREKYPGLLIAPKEDLFRNSREFKNYDNDPLDKDVGLNKTAFDLNSLFKASAAISCEIHFEKFLSNLMKILIENAGATKGHILINRNENFFIEAEGSVENEEIKVLHSIPFESASILPNSIIQYVIRTLKPLVLNDLSKDAQFERDDYIINNAPKSVLCAPLVNSGKLTGIYYLENNLNTGTFTDDRLAILKLLSSQIAISIENSQLYLNLEQKVQERTSELKDAYDKIERLALTDPLTQLSNRRDILKIVENEKRRSVRSGKPFAFVLCDIDNFKAFNDTYGHDCGDFILVALAGIFKSIIRKQDHVARWGGEEFLFIYPETEFEGAMNITEKIRDKISTSVFEYDGIDLSVTMTFGISVFDNSVDIEQCIMLADDALYRGKESGKNCVVIAG